MKFKTWHGEMFVVAVILAGVAFVRGDWREWVAAAAVLATFGHASVAERLREREAARDQVEVDCVKWTWGYFIAKEICSGFAASSIEGMRKVSRAAIADAGNSRPKAFCQRSW